MSKKILIVGGNSQLSGKIANLAKGRYEVLAIFNEHPIGLRNVQALQPDITDRRQVLDLTKGIFLF